MKNIKRVAAVAGIACAIAPSAAMAQSSSDKAYGGPGGQVKGLTEGSGTVGNTSPNSAGSPRTVKTAKASSGSSLPFTGADLGVVAGAGALLLGMGVGLRRLTYRPSSLS